MIRTLTIRLALIVLLGTILSTCIGCPGISNTGSKTPGISLNGKHLESVGRNQDLVAISANLQPDTQRRRNAWNSYPSSKIHRISTGLNKFICNIDDPSQFVVMPLEGSRSLVVTTSQSGGNTIKKVNFPQKGKYLINYPTPSSPTMADHILIECQ